MFAIYGVFDPVFLANQSFQIDSCKVAVIDDKDVLFHKANRFSNILIQL